MKEKIIENGIEYVRDGDYYIPSLKTPEGKYNIGRYGKLPTSFFSFSSVLTITFPLSFGISILYTGKNGQLLSITKNSTLLW